MQALIILVFFMLCFSLLATVITGITMFIKHLRKKDKTRTTKVIIVTAIVFWFSFFAMILLFFCTADFSEMQDTENAIEQETTVKKPTQAVVEAPTLTPTPTKAPTNTPTPTPYVETEQDYKNSCGRYNYKDILRNPDNYKEERIKVELKVKSIHEYGFFDDKYYICSASDEYGWNGDAYVVYDFRDNDFKILEDDIICVYGEIKGLTEVTYILFGNDEVVKLHMQYGELINE